MHHMKNPPSGIVPEADFSTHTAKNKANYNMIFFKSSLWVCHGFHPDAVGYLSKSVPPNSESLSP